MKPFNPFAKRSIRRKHSHKKTLIRSTSFLFMGLTLLFAGGAVCAGISAAYGGTLLISASLKLVQNFTSNLFIVSIALLFIAGVVFSGMQYTFLGRLAWIASLSVALVLTLLWFINGNEVLIKALETTEILATISFNGILIIALTGGILLIGSAILAEISIIGVATYSPLTVVPALTIAIILVMISTLFFAAISSVSTIGTTLAMGLLAIYLGQSIINPHRSLYFAKNIVNHLAIWKMKRNS